jgi:hypothetical protein
MAPSKMWSRVGLIYTDVSEERVASILRVGDIKTVKKSVRRMLFICPPPRVYVYVRPTLTNLI